MNQTHAVRFCVIFVFVMFYSTYGMAQTQETFRKARAYYLDLWGSDKNTGTKNSPWKTIKKVNSIQFKEGDTLLLKAGQVFKGTLILDSGSFGSLEQPIIITSYGKGMAVINAGKGSAIQIEKTKHLSVKKLKLIGAGRKNGNTDNGLAINNCNNIIIDHIDISGFRNAGLSVYSSLYVSITNVNAHDNGFAGISVSGDYQVKESCKNIYIGYCKAANNPGSPVMLNNHSGSGIIAGNCRKLTIEYCSATNNGWDMPRVGNGPVGIWCFEADSVTIQHCISYRNKTSKGGRDGGGFDLDGGVTNSIIQYCLSYENQGSGFGIFQYAGAGNWYNNTIRFNISENDGGVSEAGSGIFIWNSSDDSLQFKDCMFYNNTIYNRRGAAISYAAQSERTGFKFYNNIFIGQGSLLKGNKTSDIFLANDWWSLQNKFNIEGIANLGEWAKINSQKMEAEKVVGLNINPGFKNAGGATITDCSHLKKFHHYQLAPNAPLLDKGIDLYDKYGIETGGNDFNGKTVSVKGIGACLNQ
jgi:hypothetical protein